MSDFNKELLQINLYGVLGVDRSHPKEDIRRSYYKLCKNLHPDKNKGTDIEKFNLIVEAYSVLSNSESKEKYDIKSIYGKNYDETSDFLDFEFSDLSRGWNEDKFTESKKNDSLNVVKYINDSFDGTIEYERWVICKGCKGSGKDNSSKIEIKDASGNIKYFESEDGCDFCFEENNYVITKNGPIKISNISIGDLVLSKDDIYHEVTHLIEREYSGDVYDIDVSGIKINGVTPNHKFNIVRFNRNSSGRVKINDYNILEIPANELDKNDFIIYQKQSWTPKKKIILENGVEVLIDNNFIKFISCYISEGNTRGNRVSVFTFHKDKDKNLIDFIKSYTNDTFGKNAKVFMSTDHWGNYVVKIEIFDSILSRFLHSYCGHTSKNKYINSEILGKCDQILLDTLIMCDGYSKNNLHTYTTTSRKLAYQVLHLSLGLNHNASISEYNAYVDKNGVNHQICYRVYISYFHISKKMGIYNKKIKEGTCLKIKNISKRNVNLTKVYNITVKNVHKYTIDGLLVNNCEGSGKDDWGGDCNFCFGQGKTGTRNCKVCDGEKRILGKQRLTGIVFEGDSKDHKVEFMGNFAKDAPGKVGHLWLVKN